MVYLHIRCCGIIMMTLEEYFIYNAARIYYKGCKGMILQNRPEGMSEFKVGKSAPYAGKKKKKEKNCR